MRKFRPLKSTVAILLATIVLFASCSSSTTIRTVPENAKLYLDDEYVGTTPYRLTDEKILGSSTYVRIEKEGFESFNTVITKDEQANVGAIIGGIFFFFPWIWALEYKPVHQYELIPLDNYVEKVPTKIIDIEENKPEAPKSE